MDSASLDTLNDGRVLKIAAPVLLPMLESRKKAALGKLLGSFRNGNANLVGHVAELSSACALLEDVINKIRSTEKLEERVHE